jgi:hypothetical protein
MQSGFGQDLMSGSGNTSRKLKLRVRQAETLADAKV